MRQTRKRGPRPDIVVVPPVTDDVLAITTTNVVRLNQFEPGVHLVDDQFMMADPTNAVIRLGQCATWACMHTQYFGAFGPAGNTGSMSGIWMDSSVPPDPTLPNGQMPWRHLDDWIGKCETAGIQNIVLTFLTPFWMMSGGVDGASGWSEVGHSWPTVAHFPDFAEYIRRIVARYGTRVKYMMSNEWKGLWDGVKTSPTYNRWKYEEFTTMWNLAWDTLKAQNPNTQFGGPYLGFAWDTTGHLGSVANDNQLLTGTGNVDSRRLDAVKYWLANTHGYDFYTLDSGNVYGVEIITWLRAHGVTKPIYWAEFYPGIPTVKVSGVETNRAKTTAQLCENMRRIAITGGGGVFIWGPEEGSAGHLPSGAPANAFWARTNAATEELAGTYARYFKTYFPKNTPLVKVTTTNANITGLASPSNLLIINRTDASADVTVIVNSGTPTITTVPAQTALVRAIV